ncbi:MAG: TIGR03067 domain-containing protein [Gemmatales bacterium]
MAKSLPKRPHLDHLRRQAKALLAALGEGKPEALKTIQEHLPAAQGLKPLQISKLKLRLADAQSAIARQTGFASWPQLARHVEQLRNLEGTWDFTRLIVEGQELPATAMASSRILIDGDRFRTESPEAVYEGIFNINVEADPHEIDIEFIEGPEAGNWNYGIFQLEGDSLQICLNMSGKGRPATFAAPSGSGCACETLSRSSRQTPPGVTGGNRSAPSPVPAQQSCEGFEYVESKTLTRLQGDWQAVKLVLDGKEMPPAMLCHGRRQARKNEVTVTMGGQLILHALVRLQEGSVPVAVDYYHLSGSNKGAIQLGILQWQDEVACFNMAAPGQPRPTDFECPAGSGHTLSHWKRN